MGCLSVDVRHTRLQALPTSVTPGYTLDRPVKDAVRVRHSPRESGRTFRANPFFRAARRARWPCAAPIRRASSNRGITDWENSAARSSLEPSLQNGGVGVNAAVAKKRPVAADVFDAMPISRPDQKLL